jgi:hypothetical protein
MNKRSLIGRSLHMSNMRIVRSVAASFFKFIFLVLRELGALTPAFIVFSIVFYSGFYYHKFLSLQVGALN